MPFTYGFKKQFSIEYKNFPKDQQLLVTKFTDTFVKQGFVDFDAYPGKITPSWKGVDQSSVEYSFAYSNDLWHYHIGIPSYKQGAGNYLVSAWVLHFQWKNKGTHIALVDLYDHHNRDGKFYMPPDASLIESEDQ